MLSFSPREQVREGRHDSTTESSEAKGQQTTPDLLRVSDLISALEASDFPSLDEFVSPQARAFLAGRFRFSDAVPPVFVSRDGVVWHGFETIAGAVDAGIESVPVVVVEPVSGFGEPDSLGSLFRQRALVAQLTGGRVKRPSGVRVKSWNRYVALKAIASEDAVPASVRERALRLCERFEASGVVPAGAYRELVAAVHGQAAQAPAADTSAVPLLDELEVPAATSVPSSAHRFAELMRLVLALDQLTSADSQWPAGDAAKLAGVLERVADRIQGKRAADA